MTIDKMCVCLLKQFAKVVIEISPRVFVEIWQRLKRFSMISRCFIAILDTEPRKILVMEGIFKDLFTIKDEFNFDMFTSWNTWQRKDNSWL